MSNRLISNAYECQATTRKPKGSRKSIMGKPGWRPGLTMAALKARANS